MLPEIYNDLVSKLIRRTMKGEVHWRLAQGDMFSVKFQKFSLSMSRGQNYINFNISDTNGRGIDEFRIFNTDKEWDKMAAFYNQIRNKSPDVTNAIKGIIKELEEEGVIGNKDAESDPEKNKKICKII